VFISQYLFFSEFDDYSISCAIFFLMVISSFSSLFKSKYTIFEELFPAFLPIFPFLKKKGKGFSFQSGLGQQYLKEKT